MSAMFGPGRSTTHLADMVIHRLVEMEMPYKHVQEALPGLTDEVLARHHDWMRRTMLDANDAVMLCFQSYILRTPHHTILIDTCIGNDKNSETPAWVHRKDEAYMRGLAALGLTVEDIDFVMCSHLHPDHVGWNTRLLDGRWVPTFPNARYIFGRREYEHSITAPVLRPHLVDSVLPIVEARRADLVEADFGIGDHLRILPTPGHTPGHFAFEAGRGRAEAVFTGDLIHVPLQMRYPELSFHVDGDPVQAGRTRRAFLERYCDTHTQCCTAHFMERPAGLIRRWEDGFRLATD